MQQDNNFTVGSIVGREVRGRYDMVRGGESSGASYEREQYVCCGLTILMTLSFLCNFTSRQTTNNSDYVDNISLSFS